MLHGPGLGLQMGVRRCCTTWKQLKEISFRLSRLEKQVMGDSYDSEFARNNEPEASQWLKFSDGYADEVRLNGVF